VTSKHRKIPPLSASDIARFHSKYEKQNTGCWLWTGCLSPSGYGIIEIGHDNFRAPRIAYFIWYGIDPGELCVLHRCDTPSCVNPKCLFLGTDQDNRDDARAKGRWNPHLHVHVGTVPKGEDQHASKLTEQQVRKALMYFRDNPTANGPHDTLLMSCT